MKRHIKRIIILGIIFYIFTSYTYLFTISVSAISPIFNFIVRILGYAISLLLGVGLPYLLIILDGQFECVQRIAT